MVNAKMDEIVSASQGERQELKHEVQRMRVEVTKDTRESLLYEARLQR